MNGITKLDDQQCKEFNTNSGGHCNGEHIVSGNIGTYYMGAGSINSAYEVSSAASNFNMLGI